MKLSCDSAWFSIVDGFEVGFVSMNENIIHGKIMSSTLKHKVGKIGMDF